MQLNLLTGEHGGEAVGDTFVAVERFFLSGFSDSLIGGDSADFVEGGSGADTVKGSGGVDQLKGGADADKLYGDAGDDHLLGDGQSDFLYGGADNDLLQGGEGADRLYGEDGADTLEGGVGAELLYGGAGADRFVFTTVLDSTFPVNGRDVIKDFSNAEGDIIDLSAIDAVKGGADNAFTLVNAFSGVAGQLVAKVSGANTLLTADVDGDKVADFALLVENVTNLQASDFLL